MQKLVYQTNTTPCGPDGVMITTQTTIYASSVVQGHEVCVIPNLKELKINEHKKEIKGVLYREIEEENKRFYEEINSIFKTAVDYHVFKLISPLIIEHLKRSFQIIDEKCGLSE